MNAMMKQVAAASKQGIIQDTEPTDIDAIVN